VKIDLQGDPRIWEQLRPRFIAGDPPDLTFPGWGMDHYALIYENQVLPMDDALLTTPYGQAAGTWKDTFLPEILKMGQYQGQTFLLPYYLTLNGWWYNVNLFQENGWKPPATWSELLSLCEQIKAKGIAPLTHQGKYPYYALQGFVLPWAISIGGIEAYRAGEALQPGAWKNPAFLQAAQMVDELRQKGYIQEGANGMSHTEAQMEFLRGKAAMIPCGTWLESEMKKQMPQGFKMEFLLPPQVEGGKGDPTTLQVGAEPWLVPSRAQNPEVAIDYFKYLTSKEKARQFMLEKGTLTAIRDTDHGELPATLRKPAEALRNAQVTWTTNYSKWYKALEESMRTSMGALMQGSATPQQFVDQVEAAAEKTRKDPNIPKHQTA
jgi:N-acetylglucosamine transport system substrate-binding protein